MSYCQGCADAWDEIKRLQVALAEARADSERDIRFVRIGRLFAELWEVGAPWPVRRWMCNKHQRDACTECIDAARAQGVK